MTDLATRLTAIADAFEREFPQYGGGVYREAADALASITRERDAMRAVRESEWRDKADEHTTAINAAHPTNTTDPERWDRYSQALAMVGSRHGKYALVDLVNWLLTTRAAALVNGEGGE